jgi:hypothetical protein
MTTQTASNVTALNTRQANSQPQQQNMSGSEATLREFEAWREPVGATIIDEVIEAIRTYIFVSKEDAIKIAFWCLHANMYQSFKATPRLVVTAGTRGCGKTALLTICNALVNKSIMDSDTSPASFYTLVQDGGAFFLDEADEWVRGVSNEQKSQLISSIRSGFNRGGSSLRTDMSNGGRRVVRFSTWAAVAIAGISLDYKLGSAIIERSHVLHLKRAMQGDLSVRWDDRRHLGQIQELGRKVLRWSEDHKEAAMSYEYDGDMPMPESLINRRADCWEPFFAIAVELGGDWYEKIYEMAMSEPVEDDTSVDVMVFKAIKKILDQRQFDGRDDSAIGAAALALETADWVDENGVRPFATFNPGRDESETRIKDRDLIKILKSYDVKPPYPHRSRIDATKTFRGFNTLELYDACDRNIPPEEDVTCVTPVTPLQEGRV